MRVCRVNVRLTRCGQGGWNPRGFPRRNGQADSLRGLRPSRRFARLDSDGRDPQPRGGARCRSERLASGQCTGVKIVKETYDDGTGDYASVKIFEDGTCKVKIAKEADDSGPVIPCLTPDDLYSAHSRATLGRLFADTLARWKQTVTELVHRADMLERLEATGTTFQHAVQKIAVAQASGPNGQPGVASIRALNDLADRAIQRVYREDRAKRVPRCDTASDLAAYAEKKAGEGPFAIGLAFAACLAPANGWTEKLDRTLAVIAAPPQDGQARDILFNLADDIVGEILGGSAALAELIGPMPDLGSALLAMSDLYLARTLQGAGRSSVARLSAFFGADRLLDARTALGRRVLAELRTHKKLGATVDVEMLHLRTITSRLVLGPPRLVPHDDIVAAVTVRSRRLVQIDVIGDYLQDAASPAEKVERLLALEENIVGVENKRRLWDLLKPILTASTFEVALLDPRLSPMERVARAADLQKRVLKSSLIETAKDEGAALIDVLARRTLDPARIAAATDHVERGEAMMLTLVEAPRTDAVPKGASEAAVPAVLRHSLASGTLTRVLAADALRRQEVDPAANVRAILEQVGLIKPAKDPVAA